MAVQHKDCRHLKYVITVCPFSCQPWCRSSERKSGELEICCICYCVTVRKASTAISQPEGKHSSRAENLTAPLSSSGCLITLRTSSRVRSTKAMSICSSGILSYCAICCTLHAAMENLLQLCFVILSTFNFVDIGLVFIWLLVSQGDSMIYLLHSPTLWSVTQCLN